jgi:hypothetical protein
MRLGQKARERTDVRAESEYVGQQWDFLFSRTYQSTDESDNETNLDPDTESDNDEGPVRVKQRSWISRAPNYRHQDVSDC